MDFEQLYEQSYRQVYAFALSLCRDPETADDIAQETFFKALQAHQDFRGDCKTTVWLCQIAKNIFFSRRRLLSRREDADLALVPVVDDFTAALENRDSARQVHRALHRLGEPYREVFSLRIFAELSFRDIGELFGKTESWARVTFYRAKMAVRQQMKED